MRLYLVWGFNAMLVAWRLCWGPGEVQIELARLEATNPAESGEPARWIVWDRFAEVKEASASPDEPPAVPRRAAVPFAVGYCGDFLEGFAAVEECIRESKSLDGFELEFLAC
jgi:hypothetical protein